MAKLYNLARMTTATEGTGTITLGSAVDGFLSFAGAGVQDGETVTYAIKDGTESEIGRGTYTSSGTTLSRTVLKSTNSDAAIDLSGGAEVFITAAAEDISEPLDALFLDQRMTTLIVSDALNTAIFSGPDGSAIHDHFDALTYVDDENAIDLDTSEAGCLKPLAAGGGTTQTIRSTSTTSNYASSFTIVDMGTALTAGDTINEIGVYSTTARTGLKVKIVTKTATNTFNVVADSTSFNHTGSGFENHALPSPYTIPGTGSYYVAVYYPGVTGVNVTVSVARAVQGSVDATGNGVTITESTGAVPPMRVLKNVSSGNVSVSSLPISAAEQPETMRALLLLYDAIGVTLNTDAFVDLSRDGGATWATASLVEIYTQPGDIRVLDTGNVDVSAQPSGSSMLWRWRTANTIAAKNLGMAMWGTS